MAAKKKDGEQQEAAPQKAVKPTAAPKGYVEVENVAKSWIVQFSTKTVIHPGERKPLKDDGWLAAQIKAGLLKKV